MPEFKITSPDGAKYRVNAPEGATEKDAMAYVQHNQDTLKAVDKGPVDPGKLRYGFSDIPHEIGEKFRSGAHEFKEGMAQVGKGYSEIGKPDEKGNRLVKGAGDVLAGAGKEALGALEVATSPISGAAKALVGNPIRAGGSTDPNTVGGFIRGAAANLAEDVGEMAGPGMVSKAAKTIGGAVLPMIAKGSEAIPAAVRAREAGYVLPPSMASESPSIASQAAQGMGGKAKVRQLASMKNQGITNDLAARSLDLPKGAELNEATFKKIREDAGKEYDRMVTAIPHVVADDEFREIVRGLGGANSATAKMFPSIVKNPKIDQMAKNILEQTSPTSTGVANAAPKEIPTSVAKEVVKALRFQANQNFKALGDPAKHALGSAQRETAEAIDDLIERNLAKVGKEDLVDNYRKARQKIARAYDIEGVTNLATGDVSAKGLARLADMGKPLGDDLMTIADAARAFPHAMKTAAEVGGNENWSGLDFFGSAASVGHGNPAIAAGILARPAIRGTILSEPYQNAMIGKSPSSPPGYLDNLVSSALGKNP